MNDFPKYECTFFALFGKITFESEEEKAMLLFVGLGNPGKEYEKTRHNTGFACIDAFCKDRFSLHIEKKGFGGLYTSVKSGTETLLFLKPQTYMNLSGNSVREIVNFFKIPMENVIVIYDDMDLETGKIRLRGAGSSGGHKGMKSVIENLGTEEIKRIRVGIGRNTIPVIDYVLEKPNSEQQKQLDEAILKAEKAMQDIVERGFDHAMNVYNR